MKELNVAKTCGIVGTIFTFLFVLALTASCTSGPEGPKRTIPKFLSIKTSVSGLEDETIPVTIRIYNTDTDQEHIWNKAGNGPYEIGIMDPEEGNVYIIIAEAEGHTVQPESYKVRIADGDNAVITNNETSEEVSQLDFQFTPEGTIKVIDVNKIAIQPEPGSYLGTPDGELSKVLLQDVQIRKGVCDKDYFSPWFPSAKKGDPCLVVSGHVQNQDKDKFHIGMSALGYDETGEAVAGTLDAAHIAGAIGLYLEYEETGEFTMHLNFSDNISTVRIFAQSAPVPLP